MKTFTIMIAAACLAPMIALADDEVETQMKGDVILRALVDELERGSVGLELEDMKHPYFIEYSLLDATGTTITAQLGAVTDVEEDRFRLLRAGVRVGSYELDNANFAENWGGYADYASAGIDADVPIEDDYNAIRQSIWWTTDRRYKAVVETFARKKAFMESKLIEDKPNDFSRETPTVHFEEKLDVKIDSARLKKIAVTLSERFRSYPQVKQSSVRVRGGGGNKYLVNTEGTRMRISGLRFAVLISAAVQADDGMELVDSITIRVRKFDDLPPVEKLLERIDAMVQQLTAVKDAPVLDAYTGPVLFDPPVAAVVFATRMASRFTGGQRQVGGRSPLDDFAKKLGRRILPRNINIIDDPTMETFHDVPVMGHYQYDDQGVKGRRVSLVEGGRLTTLLMSRNPSKEFSQSTGHGRGLYRPAARSSCMILEAEDSADNETLLQELIEACEDEGLEYGIRIAALGAVGGGRGFSYHMTSFDSGAGGGSDPLAIYKVYPDGREELVRGADVARIDLKAFKRMLAVGDTPHVLNTPSGTGKTVIVPALLFEELDLAKVDQDFEKPPILPTPLARNKQE